MKEKTTGGALLLEILREQSICGKTNKIAAICISEPGGSRKQGEFWRQMSTAASTVFSAYNKRVSQSGVKLGILSVEKDKGASSIKIMISVWERHLNIGRPLILTIHSMQVRSTILYSYYAIDNYLSQAFDML